MDFPTGLIIVCVLYGILLFFDTFFKTCAHYPYLQFLKGTGFEIKIFQIRWTTTAFNRILVRWGIKLSKLLNFWFNLGIYASLLLLPVAFCILFISLYQDFFSKSGESTVMLQPIVPYVNLPASEISYYSISLLISSVYHELGHALAAVTEDVHIINLGTNIIFVLPIAYVNLSSDKLFALNKWKILKIICAGVWHNSILTAVFYILYISSPVIFSLFFSYGNGVFISEISKKSPVLGDRGLFPGDTIIQINDCVVTDENSWYDCLRTIRNVKPGFCIHSDLVHQLDESVPLKHLDSYVSCCDNSKTNNLCFEYLEVDAGVLELPPYACLPGRTVIESSNEFCTLPPHFCPEDLHCFRPFFKNATNLYKIKRLNKPNIIYVGPIYDLGSFKVSPYVPNLFFGTSDVPDSCVKLFGYIAVFSLGLAIVNILPCAYMDGQYISNALVSILCRRKLNEGSVKIVSNIVVICTTLLLMLHLVVVVFTKILF